MGTCDSNLTGPCEPSWTSHDLPNTSGPLSRSWRERGYLETEDKALTSTGGTLDTFTKSAILNKEAHEMDSSGSIANCGPRRFRDHAMKRFSLIVLLFFLVPSFPISAEGNHKHLYLCRSPLLAFERLARYSKPGGDVDTDDRSRDLQWNESWPRSAVYAHRR
jgi:hypothetical protein